MTNSEGGKRTSSELKFVKRRNSLNPDYSSIQPLDNSLLTDQYLRVNKNRKHSYDLSKGRALQRQKTEATNSEPDGNVVQTGPWC